VFPECALTGYCFASPEEAREAALEREGPALLELARMAALTGVHLVVGYLERTETGLANSVSVLGARGILAHYRKTHLPHLGADRFTDAGKEPFRVHEVAGLRLGLLICYDASFPEASRLLALAGADLLLLPTNWPEEAEEKAGWLPNARAYENVVYFAAVNRVGEERGYRFHGRSRVCDPTGRTMIDGPVDQEAVLVFDVDPGRARQKRIVRREGYWVDRIGQRREDLYRLTPVPEEEEG
jgi:predicted amidohydrolase